MTAAGPVLTAVTVGDPPEAWRAAGFTVDDDGRCRIGTVAVHLVGRDAGKRILGWSFDGLTGFDGETGVDGDLDGLVTSASPAPAGPAPTHPNGVERIDHVVVLTPDRDRTIAAFTAAGLEPRRSRETDTYGAPMVQTFFRAGEVIVELIGTPEPMGDGPAGFFGLAHTCADLDATATLLDGHVGVVKDAVQPGRRITTLRHKDLGMSVATAFMSR
ncbi:MAG: VOC family protein [Acidimicrobiales bacterium]